MGGGTGRVTSELGDVCFMQFYFVESFFLFARSPAGKLEFGCQNESAVVC